MVRRTLLMLVAASLLVVGCSPGATATEAPTPTQEPVETSVEAPPVFFLMGTNGPPIPGQAGSWCWKGTCVATEAPPDIVSFIPIGTPTIQIQAAPPTPNQYHFAVWPKADPEARFAEIVIPDGDTVEWTPAVPPGEYVLSVQGTWNDGSDITYYFGVNTPITESDVPLPGDDGAPTPPKLTLVLPDGSEHAATQGTYCWSNGNGGMCADMVWPPMVTETVAVGAGDELEFRFAELPPPSVTVALYDATGMDQTPATIGDQLTSAEIQVSPEGIATWTPDVQPGRYLLTIQAFWMEDDNTSQGDSMYAFLLDIQ